MGAPRVVGLFAEQVGQRLPLPWDQQLAAVARGMQATGIVLCFMNDRPLGQCSCLIDLVNTEGKALVRRLVADAAKDWLNLHELQPPTPRQLETDGGQSEGYAA